VGFHHVLGAFEWGLGVTWLGEERADLAAERILDAAAQLFAEQGVDAPGMDVVAREAGCSRATLYRYFPNRRALQVAFARREAVAITAEVAERVGRLRDPARHMAASVIGCLQAVRARPHLAAWYADAGAPVLREVLQESALVEEMSGADPDRARWMLRIVLSFLTDPGVDEADEHRLIQRFVGS